LAEYHLHPWEHQASPSLGDFLETKSHPSGKQEGSPGSIEFARMGMIKVNPR